MKVLVVYYSQTGNTEKIAQAIQEEASQSNEATLMKIEDVDPGGVKDFDLIVIGSPLHAGNLSGPVKDFLDNMQVEPGKKLACFITHAAPAYPDQELGKFNEPVQAACDKNKIEFAGSFACQGFLTPELHEMIKERQGATDEEWAEKVEQMTGHPDEIDLENARTFIRGIL
jgi:flavodoxin I